MAALAALTDSTNDPPGNRFQARRKFTLAMRAPGHFGIFHDLHRGVAATTRGTRLIILKIESLCRRSLQRDFSSFREHPEYGSFVNVVAHV